MISKIPHQYSNRANQTLLWEGYDIERRYQYNLKFRYDLLQKYGWVDKDILYKYNSHGFRCEEFNLEPSVLFLGCSFTCGIGLPFEDVWTYKVANELKLKQINLGIGGTSLNTSFRIGHFYIPMLQPKMVILLEQEKQRLEIIGNNYTFYDILPSFHGYTGLDDFYKVWISEDTNSDMNRLKNVLALEHICNIHSIKFHSFSIDEFVDVDRARDLGHRGVKSNQLFATQVLNKINKLA